MAAIQSNSRHSPLATDSSIDASPFCVIPSYLLRQVVPFAASTARPSCDATMSAAFIRRTPQPSPRGAIHMLAPLPPAALHSAYLQISPSRSQKTSLLPPRRRPRAGRHRPQDRAVSATAYTTCAQTERVGAQRGAFDRLRLTRRRRLRAQTQAIYAALAQVGAQAPRPPSGRPPRSLPVVVSRNPQASLRGAQHARREWTGSEATVRLRARSAPGGACVPHVGRVAADKRGNRTEHRVRNRGG